MAGQTRQTRQTRRGGPGRKGSRAHILPAFSTRQPISAPFLSLDSPLLLVRRARLTCPVNQQLLVPRLCDPNVLVAGGVGGGRWAEAFRLSTLPSQTLALSRPPQRQRPFLSRPPTRTTQPLSGVAI
jgi:hypothetical protein